MHLRALRLQNFRNHLDTSFEFTPGINVLLGENGQGKTNVLEAISYLCLTRSFFEAGDSLVVRFGEEFFSVEGQVVSGGGSAIDIRVAYTEPQHEKVFTINKRRVEPFSAVIGKFPVVISSPEHAPIVSGGPSERRRFVDVVISQSNSLYFQELVEYRKVVKHRNKILLDARIGRKDPAGLLEPWDQQLVTLGSSLSWKRNRFVTEFRQFMVSSYHHLVGAEEEPSMEYRPESVTEDWTSVAAVEDQLSKSLRTCRPEELRVGTTLVGPHRDEFVMRINSRDLRKFGSQGQQKTFLVALKIGEFFYLKDRCGETPMLLLDDIFSELDERRAAQLLSFTGDLSQTFVTSTNPRLFEHSPHGTDQNKRFLIHEGMIVQTSSMTTA